MSGHKFLIRLLQLGVFLSLMLYGYSHLYKPLASWRDEQLVVVVSRNTTLSDEEFSKQLAKQFADYLHVPLKIILSSADGLATTLREHRAHLSASGFRLNQKNNGLLLGPAYMTVHEQVAFNQSQRTPHKLSDLIGKHIAVIAGSNHERTLIALKKILPALTWESRSKQTVEDLLREVAQNKLDYTLANHEQIEQMNNFYLNLAVAFNVGTPSQIAWAFPANSDNELIKKSEQFFTKIKKNGQLDKLMDRYYGHNDRLAPLDAAGFIKKTQSTLPKFLDLFKEAGRAINEDWRLIAAISYQESHWDPLATSFTHVRGMMMLTEATADRMKVANRLNARESLMGGAKYLQLLKKRLPDHIKEPVRTWLALASYNQGQGHLEDARVLTQRQGDDADTWIGVKKWMPKLSNPHYFHTLKYGYARGGEAVIFVENIRAYYDMLTRLYSHVESDSPVTHQYQLISTRKHPAFSLHKASTAKPSSPSYSLSE